ncbi:MAG: D-aminoacyl-tRNA deacylase [Melioribacteraceae bacterium]|nr:D-aminoacyl-tRNA deacylase [Melioribacteraceae bacterium]
MRAVVQRVSKGSVKIDRLDYFSKIGKGFVILLGITHTDTITEVEYLADKCTNLRIFEDANEKMNLSLKDVEGEILIISQFTLYAETAKGNRPSFIEAARPEIAIEIYNKFVEKLKKNIGAEKVKTGVFGEMMAVEIHNEGPVTIIVESK